MTSAPQLTAAAQTVLFDFDGPVCNFFSGLPNPYAADHVRGVLLRNAQVELSDHLATTPDSFEILRATPTLAPSLTGLIEHELAAVEDRAAALAAPTPGALDAIRSLRAEGKAIGIVSNTAQSAILIYLDRHDLHPYVDGVFGRRSPDPALLKPSPHLVTEALTRLDADPRTTVLIGDQPTDVEAAHRGGIASIGYANKPGKDDRLRAAGATAIVIRMGDVVALPLVANSAGTRHRTAPARPQADCGREL